jgi:hypothetical protein
MRPCMGQFPPLYLLGLSHSLRTEEEGYWINATFSIAIIVTLECTISVNTKTKAVKLCT